MPAQWQQARLDQTSSVESHQPARRTLRHVSLPASHIQRLTSFPSVKRERSALDKRPDCGFTKKGGCTATGVEKQVVGFGSPGQEGKQILTCGFPNRVPAGAPRANSVRCQ